MSQTLSPSLARGYGMSRVTRVWKISRASVAKTIARATGSQKPSPQ
jgi:hypothetical protein